ncbi:MetQ/NlpA family ABC transporter substrate-binding protein [Lactobacillaceae bacterium Melli_B4]
MSKKKRLQWTSLGIVAVLIVILGFVVFAGQKSSSPSSSSNSNGKETTVKVGLLGVDDKPIWNEISKQVAKDNIKIDLKIFSDVNLLDQATASGEVDINSFQHYAFLNQEIKQKHYKLSVIGQTYMQQLNVYSKNLKSLKDIKDGAKIAIPNNPTNAGRALKVLQKAGLIKTNPDKGYAPSLSDVTSNPKHLDIIEVDPAAIIKLLPSFAAGITNSNYVLANGMSPEKDSIYRIAPDINDPYNKPWINVLVARTSEKDNAAYKKIVKAYNTKEVAKLIEKIYKSAASPAFKY